MSSQHPNFNRIIDECDSTNRLAKEFALSGAPHGTWIAARKQTSGRGRQGRSWISDEGNLFLSVVLRVKNPEYWTWVPLVSAVGVLEALKNMPGNEGIVIKWPNDLWFNGKKLAGFLCEGAAKSDPFIVVGLGLNCKQAPSMGISLTEIAGKPVGFEDVLPRIVSALKNAIAEFAETGPEPFQKRYEERAYFRAGDRLSWSRDSKTQQGVLKGLGRHGELLVDQADGKTVRLFAEDVEHVRS